MPDHVAFLKGMNLGKRRITNGDLRAAVEGLGFEQVETFRASGNVVFAAGRRSDSALQGALEEGLLERLGYEVPTFIRSGAELRQIAATAPFSADGWGGKLQVAFLHEPPGRAAARQLASLHDDHDRLGLQGRELYWLPEGGVSESPLDWKAIADLLGPATVRTMGTVEQIAARWFA